MFLQRKKSRGNFTTSTPAPQTSSPHTLPTSSSQAVETSNEFDSVCRKTPSLVTTAVEQGEKCAKKGLTDEDWSRMDAILDKHLGKSLNKKLDKVGKENCVGPLESKDEEQPDETFEDDSDNLEDAKKWTIRQKLSFTNRKQFANF